MCGRFSLAIKKPKLKAQLDLLDGLPEAEILPRFNIAPTQNSWALTMAKPRVLQLFEWGLVPFWSKTGENTGKLINARTEGIAEKPSFREPIRSRRCLVLADSFYEWKTDPATGKKRPMRIFPKNGDALIMAGIFDHWEGQTGEKRPTFSILTCPPNREMREVHDRMPVFFHEKEIWERWLSPNLSINEVLEMAKTPDDGLLEMYRVSDRLGSTLAEGPGLHERVGENPTLF